MFYALAGSWEAVWEGASYPVTLPGTLDENNIGYADSGEDQRLPPGERKGGGAPIAGRFTRKHTYEGPVTFRRVVDWQPPQGRRVFFQVGRARHLRLLVDGQEVAPFEEPTISTPYVFEVTGLLKPGSQVELISDNSYPGWPHDAIVYSSAATDETQTNWNGVLGDLGLRDEAPVFLRSVRVYPGEETLSVQVEVSAAQAYRGTLSLASPALAAPVERAITLEPGEHLFQLEDLPLAAGVRRWDEYEGNLYQLTAALSGSDEKTARFGVRTFGVKEGRLALNGRAFFLRGEANCAEFPEEGHPPMTVEAWRKVLEMYKAYGVNVMRFHSHCPPEAAFAAADELGMMMQPELSHWNPHTAFLDQESLDSPLPCQPPLLCDAHLRQRAVDRRGGHPPYPQPAGYGPRPGLHPAVRLGLQRVLRHQGLRPGKRLLHQHPVFHPHDSRHQRPGGERPRPPARVYQQQVPRPRGKLRRLHGPAAPNLSKARVQL